jgi:cytosine/uracil/thiamine/allantoin permease
MDRYESFLFLLGSVFVPLFGILAADHFIVRRSQIDISSLYRSGGKYWFSNGVRLGALVTWVAGFLTYHWVLPTGPEWWVSIITTVTETPLSVRWPWLSASILSFGVAFLLALVRPKTLRWRQ